MKFRKRFAAMGAAIIMAISSMAVTASASSYTNSYPTYIDHDFDSMVMVEITQRRANTWGWYDHLLCSVYGRCEYVPYSLGVFVGIKKNDSWGDEAFAKVQPQNCAVRYTDLVYNTGPVVWSAGSSLNTSGYPYPGVDTEFRGYLYY